jgi:hypothetical protein
MIRTQSMPGNAIYSLSLATMCLYLYEIIMCLYLYEI